MPSKKRKTKSRQKKSKAATSKQAKNASRKRWTIAPKRTVAKKQSKKKTSSKGSPARRSRVPVRRARQLESPNRSDANAVVESGDLEGLSRTERADSESVDELVEEGNAFEAGAVAGVEEADDQDTREVHTHEVPEDDVPEEYLDKD